MSDSIDITGDVVGAVGPPEAGAIQATDSGSGWDFAIGDLRFHIYSTDDHPYERATAPFRKEQLDTTTEYGDQSLVGLWTRGQMSFHKGAGVEYYDVGGDGSDLLNTFSDSYGVNPWTPGEVRLSTAMGTTTEVAAGIKDMALGQSFITGTEQFFLLSDGTLRARPSGGPVRTPATTTAADSKAITHSTWNVYVGVGSAIEVFTPTAATGTVKWTFGGAARTNILGLWYAKSRLWAVDEEGRWFMLAPAGGAIADAATEHDFIVDDYTFPNHSEDSWTLAESPSAIYIGIRSKVYRVGVDTSSTTPTVGQPVQVAELPRNESISHLEFTLGHLVIATDQGVRLGVEQGEGIVYGPLLADDGDFSSCNGIATNGTRVLLMGEGETENAVYAIDLSLVDGDLRAPHCRELPVAGGPITYSGATHFIFGVMSFWRDDLSAVYTTASYSSPTPTGWLQTGLHRFNTLESKKFLTVNVRVGGVAGTVLVSKVVAGGTVVPLQTIDVAEEAGAEINLAETRPTELLGLRFTLTSSGGESPILRGYQLKALPAPQRQRLIRVPLLLHDQERRGTTRATGRTGSAWERLKALEEMEASGGTFTFQDFRTGEIGQCYIESIEHRGTTPPSRQSSGFGGSIFLTLRKL